MHVHIVAFSYASLQKSVCALMRVSPYLRYVYVDGYYFSIALMRRFVMLLVHRKSMDSRISSLTISISLDLIILVPFAKRWLFMVLVLFYDGGTSPICMMRPHAPHWLSFEKADEVVVR